MTEQEKELIELYWNLEAQGKGIVNMLDFAKALIQRYPQILAEKVWEGSMSGEGMSNLMIGEFSSAFKNKHIEMFIREVKE